MPVKFEKTEGLNKGQNTIDAEKQDNLFFPRIENNEHKQFLPMVYRLAGISKGI